MRTTSMAMAFAFPLFVFGCAQQVESTDVRTSGIFPEITVTADGSGTAKVLVRLKAGGRASNTYLELVGDDTLTAMSAGLVRTLDADVKQPHAYGAVFPTDSSGPFVISLLRGKRDASAPASTVTLPGTFQLAAAVAATNASRATNDVALTWDGAAGPGDLELSLVADCLQPIFETTPDDGAHTISRDRLRPKAGASATTCAAHVTLIRQQSGQVDAAFTEGGMVWARQMRTMTFTSAP